MDISRAEPQVASGVLASQLSTSLAHPTELPKDSIVVGVTPKAQGSIVIEPPVTKNVIRATENKPEDNIQAPSQPSQPSQPPQPSQTSKPAPSVPSGQSGAPHPKVAPPASSEGIAQIAHLAVGSKGPSIPKPFSGGCDPNASVDAPSHKQTAGPANVSANAGQCPFSGSSSYQPITAPGRVDRPPMMVGSLQQPQHLERVKLKRLFLCPNDHSNVL